MRVVNFFCVGLAASLAGGCASISEQEEEASLAGSLMEISLQKPGPEVPKILLDSPHEIHSSYRWRGVVVNLPSGEYWPLGQTEWGVYYQSPDSFRITGATARSVGIFIPTVPEWSQKIWIADFLQEGSEEQALGMAAIVGLLTALPGGAGAGGSWLGASLASGKAVYLHMHYIKLKEPLKFTPVEERQFKK